MSLIGHGGKKTIALFQGVFVWADGQCAKAERRADGHVYCFYSGNRLRGGRFYALATRRELSYVCDMDRPTRAKHLRDRESLEIK